MNIVDALNKLIEINETKMCISPKGNSNYLIQYVDKTKNEEAFIVSIYLTEKEQNGGIAYVIEYDHQNIGNPKFTLEQLLDEWEIRDIGEIPIYVHPELKEKKNRQFVSFDAEDVSDEEIETIIENGKQDKIVSLAETLGFDEDEKDIVIEKIPPPNKVRKAPNFRRLS